MNEELVSLFKVEGVEGIMAAYSSALHNVTLAGPTIFGPVINTAAQIAAQSLSQNITKYYVLLIITVRNISGSVAFSFACLLSSGIQK